MKPLTLIRGGGDLASGVGLRLRHAGIPVIVTELARPLAVRRKVAFSEAVYDGEAMVEDVPAKRTTPDQVMNLLADGIVPVLIDPEAEILNDSRFAIDVVVDARLLKTTPTPLPRPVNLHIGLGPGFRAPRDCHAVIETNRGHTLGRVYWIGETQPDTQMPEGDMRRVLRASADGTLVSRVQIGDHVGEGQIVSKVRATGRLAWDRGDGGVEIGAVTSPISGVVRGLLRDGTFVTRGLKIGDIDPRDDPALCGIVSDKALAVGGAVLEAMMTKQ